MHEINVGVESEELPLFDPDRDVLALPGLRAAAHPWVPQARRDHAWVCDRLSAAGVSGAVFPALSAMHPKTEAELRRRVLAVFHCLQQLAESYRRDTELRDFLAIPERLRRWIVRDRRPEHLRIDLCRFDLLGNSLGTLRVLEFNTNSPGGLLSRGQLHRLWRTAPGIAELVTDWGAGEALFERADWFVRWLLALAARSGLDERRTARVGLFRAEKGNHNELGLMARQVTDSGRIPVPLAPEDVAQHDELSLGYLKYDMRDALRDIHRWTEFAERVLADRLVIPNRFAGRWVADNKLCLAVLSDPRFRRLFDPAAHRELDALVPWSRKLGDGVTVREVIRDRAELVLKGPYDAKGRSVHLGRQCDPSEWEALVRDPGRHGWLVQRYVPPPRIETAAGPYYRDLGIAVVDGRIAGYTSRIGRDLMLNVAQGAATQAVFGHYRQETTDGY